jgi:uncharacterized membrane protein YfcA
VFHTDFNFWFREGLYHILSVEALDHILFITVLCIAHCPERWKQTLILITAFTLGHSITLAGVALGYIQVNIRWVEFLIPLTIAFTALRQLFKKNGGESKSGLLYGLALVFGFIHGMAYGAGQVGSLYTRQEAVPLVLAFNLGIEAAQLAVVAIVLGLNLAARKLLKIPENNWRVLLSSCILLYALYLAVKNFPVKQHKTEMVRAAHPVHQPVCLYGGSTL